MIQDIIFSIIFLKKKFISRLSLLLCFLFPFILLFCSFLLFFYFLHIKLWVSSIHMVIFFSFSILIGSNDKFARIINVFTLYTTTKQHSSDEIFRKNDNKCDFFFFASIIHQHTPFNKRNFRFRWFLFLFVLASFSFKCPKINFNLNTTTKKEPKKI